MADAGGTVPVLPCNDGICMMCKQKPSPEEILHCKTFLSPWHVSCLPFQPHTVAEALDWECPDCASPAEESPGHVNSVGDIGGDGGLVAAIKALETNESLTESEKAKKRQALLSKTASMPSDDETKMNGGNDDALKRRFRCTICMGIPERPVTTPCGHNFCLKCYNKHVAECKRKGGKLQCANCRGTITEHLKINEILVRAIHRAIVDRTQVAGDSQSRMVHYLHNQDRPDRAFRTERAKKAGNANASAGRVFVTVPKDHLGPITAEHDPERNEGVLVGRTWENRLECVQWGVHRAPVAGICGQSNHGAQSIVLSGGYEDDEDHGECGGKDLGGNKRTNKEHSSDQKFVYRNESLRISCWMGYPVRVVRGMVGSFVRKVNTDLMNAVEEMQQKLKDMEEERRDEEVEAQESGEIDNAGKETVDEAKGSISPAPETTETTPQQACEKKPTRKRKMSNNTEIVVDAGVAVRSKKGKMAVAAAV
ncbi:hypothetical protein ACLB2K_042364 [Fragaria x ananassa]